MFSTAGQIFFLLIAFAFGYNREPVWWLIPLTLFMAIFSWLTDRWWKLRFYDIYDLKAWTRFWTETMFGMACFVALAYGLGRLAKNIVHFTA